MLPFQPPVLRTIVRRSLFALIKAATAADINDATASNRLRRAMRLRAASFLIASLACHNDRGFDVCY